MDPQMLNTMMAQLGISPEDLQAYQDTMGAVGIPETSTSPPQFHPGMSEAELRVAIPRYKAWLEEDRKILPQRARYVSRQTLLSFHNRVRQARWSDGLPQGEVSTRMTISGFPKHSSIVPLERLERICFSQMLVRKVHLGSYLLCRSIAPSSSVQLLVEDPEGTTHYLTIYNFPTTFQCSLKYLDDLLPVGTIFAIREPTFKAPTTGDYPIVRVDSPSDIILVSPGHSVLKGVAWRTHDPSSKILAMSTVDSCRDRGNAFFKASHWLPAALMYSRGLAADPEATVLLSNRAEVYLRLGFWSGAIADARRVRTNSDAPEALRNKAVFREAKAEYARGNYKTAEDLFLQWQSVRPDDEEVKGWISRARKRQAEQETGQYDWETLFNQSQSDHHLDVAEFRGPIEVQQVSRRGGGRGIVAVQDIEIGQLLVAKPFHSVYERDLHPNEIMLSVDLITSKMNTRTQSALLAGVMQKLLGNPELHGLVFDLYAGPDSSPPSSYPPVISPDVTPVDPSQASIDIDVARLDAIISFNGFSPSVLEPISCRSKSRPEEGKPSGLYLLPSLFNHACQSNAVWTCVGDVMVIRATKRIILGEEITIPYTSAHGNPYEERRAILRRFSIDECGCSLCQDDRKDDESAHKMRDELLAKRKSSRLTDASTAQLLSLEQQFAATYSPSRGPCKPRLADIQHAIAETLRKPGSTASIPNAIEYEKKALESLGFIVLGKDAMQQSESWDGTKLPIDTAQISTASVFDIPALCMLRLAHDYLRLSDTSGAIGWLKTAQWLVATWVGGDKMFFMRVMAPVLEEWKLKRLAASVVLSDATISDTIDCYSTHEGFQRLYSDMARYFHSIGGNPQLRCPSKAPTLYHVSLYEGGTSTGISCSGGAAPADEEDASTAPKRMPESACSPACAALLFAWFGEDLFRTDISGAPELEPAAEAE
ncbi:hypothetical protein POSPLADRAFT_1151025 [Postia placenta MAD-698-R-SB12]|uniref:SET domain-containing protein n=1 Tax=Postia placenta MAD-698-R-SB12 TaxID=670580 RepID=A0A1X6MTF1_9APHY|nr:hypothetical protein POSPLADRAFT_1151025 [Postia placenta MAD-698-R-SB12]OSX59453.1 hypothetical protein POSPLADRAFT_1151025 [Postia placenta MAD-698-R-SB12]